MFLNDPPQKDRPLAWKRSLAHLILPVPTVITCWMLWPDAPAWFVVPIMVGFLASVFWGIWLFMRDIPFQGEF